MSIVDNKVLDPKLVANVDADLQPQRNVSWEAYPIQQLHGWMCIYRNIFHGCSPDWNH